MMEEAYGVLGKKSREALLCTSLKKIYFFFAAFFFAGFFFAAVFLPVFLVAVFFLAIFFFVVFLALDPPHGIFFTGICYSEKEYMPFSTRKESPCTGRV